MDVNNPTGRSGLLAIDKRGCRALFLNPATYEEEGRLDLPARPHELAITPDHRTAYVSIYGSGVYGNNPEPGRTIAVIDLRGRQHTDTLDVAPYLAPHGLALDPDGLLYASCDESGVVAVVDPARRVVVGAIDVGSRGNHQIGLLPDGSKLYSENEDQAPFVSVLDPRARRRIAEVPIPRGALGLCASADGRRVLVTDGQEPALLVIDTRSDTLVDTVPLDGYAHPAQRVRGSPDGRFVVVTADREPLASVLDGSLARQSTFEVADGPMGVAFHPDGRTALVANHGAGRITVVDLEAGRPTGDFAAGVGVETLTFY
jgi:DNA-binding beta-propeller fold protein YncE